MAFPLFNGAAPPNGFMIGYILPRQPGLAALEKQLVSAASIIAIKRLRDLRHARARIDHALDGFNVLGTKPAATHAASCTVSNRSSRPRSCTKPANIEPTSAETVEIAVLSVISDTLQ